MGKILIIAEKPSVARDIARVVGANQSKDGFIEGNDYVVSWAIGHLVGLPQPHEINPEWKEWKKEHLPMLPKMWPLTVMDKTKSQFSVLKKLMKSCNSIVCATDAGREGELIFRYIYEAAECRKPVKRLWISSLTADAIQDGLRKLKDSKDYNCLADAARARSCADWLIGMNLSRAYAITYNQQYFVGRVQTPTLAMVLKRDLEIRNFKPEKYLEILGLFALSEGSRTHETFEGVYVGGSDLAQNELPSQGKRLPVDGALAQKTIERVKRGQAKIRLVESKSVKQQPPLLYDLTELQRHANRLFGYSASKTLEVAQALYEKHKLISYPRTASKHLSQSVSETLPKIVTVIRPSYEKYLTEGTGTRKLDKRFINDEEVTDHHAIIPTVVSGDKLKLTEEEMKLYDLICRRLLSAWQKEYITGVTTVFTQVDFIENATFECDLFRSQGTTIEQLGWKSLELNRDDKNPEETVLPGNLQKEQRVTVKEIKAVPKTTKAPPNLTDSTLLTAMESAGKSLEDRELAIAMRDSGLGTPATRASTIETLISRGYMERRGKSVVATDLGERLIQTVHPSVKSPELTGRWEKELALIQSGNRTLTEFMTALESELKDRIREVVNVAPGPRSPQTSTPTQIKPQEEQQISAQILKVLAKDGSRAAGRLYEDVSKTVKSLGRKDFEGVLQNLAIKGGITICQESFEKDGKSISYRKVALSST